MQTKQLWHVLMVAKADKPNNTILPSARIDRAVRESAIAKRNEGAVKYFVTGVVEALVLSLVEQASDHISDEKKRLTRAQLPAIIQSCVDLNRFFTHFVSAPPSNTLSVFNKGQTTLDFLLPVGEAKVRAAKKKAATERRIERFRALREAKAAKAQAA